MIQAGFITDALDTAKQWFIDLWAGLWSPISDAWPLWWSYGVVGLIVLGCLFLAFFLQFKWVRLGLLLIIALAVAWLTGRHTMYNEIKPKLDAARRRPPPKPKPPEDPWRWPW